MPIAIVGGARVSGQVDKYDVGLLAMKTEELGSTPSNSYLVGRVKRNIFRTSWIGAINVAIAASGCAAGTTGGIFMIRLCRPSIAAMI